MAKKTEVTELKSAIEQLNQVTKEQYEIDMQAAKAAQAKAAALGSVTSNAQLLAEQSKVNISLAQKRIDTLSQTDAALRRSVQAYKQAEHAGRRLTAASKEEQ